jgi:hypothetical protein
MDAGHYVSRKHAATRYDERNVHPQCRACNRFDGGNAAGYALFLIRTYGQEIIEELNVKGHQVYRSRRPALEEMIDDYSRKLRDLKGAV